MLRRTRLLVPAVAVALTFLPAVSRADISPSFADVISVDPSYATGVSGATDIAFSGDGRAVISTKSGQVVIRRADGTKTNLMNLFGTVDTQSEKGLLGVVAHPDVAQNGTFFFYVSNGSSQDDKHRVYRGVLSASDELTIDMANPVIAASRNLGPGLRGPANHDGGGLFIHENHLYVGVGDTGANATPPTNKYSSCLNVGNGKILRVNLDGTIPTSNPLVNVAEVTACDGTGSAWTTAAPDRRIFAWGFRNPWRLWIDPQTDLMWIGDVGETTREEISVGGGDQHYGYPFFEGTTDWSRSGGNLRLQKDCTEGFLPPRPCTPPITDHARGSGGSVTGGLIPSGCGWSNAFGGRTLYIYGDYSQNFVRALEVNAARDGVVSPMGSDFGTFAGGVVSFRMGPDAALYMVFNREGSVYRFAPSSLTGSDCDVTPGTGGSGGAAGAGGTAGSATGGASGEQSGGRVGSGGVAATAGANAAGANAAGNGGSSGTAKRDDGGCGCRLAARPAGAFALTLAGLGVVLCFGRRRRR